MKNAPSPVVSPQNVIPSTVSGGSKKPVALLPSAIHPDEQLLLQNRSLSPPSRLAEWLSPVIALKASLQQKLRGKGRLLFIIMLPIFMLCGLGASELAAQISTINLMNRIDALVDLNEAFSHIVFDLQTEMAYTLNFLYTKGKDSIEELLNTRYDTDEKIAHLYTELVPRSVLSDVFKVDDFEELTPMLKVKLRDYRDRILLQQMGSEEAEELYDHLNTLMLNIIGHIAQHSRNSMFQQRFILYWCWIYLTEHASLKRSGGIETFYNKGWKSQTLLNDFVHFIIVEEHINITAIDLGLDTAAVNQVRASDPDWTSQQQTILSAMDELLISNDTAGISGITPMQWFANQTVEMDNIQRVEAVISDAIINKMHEELRSAEGGTILFGCLFGGIAVLLIFILFWLAKQVKQLAEAEYIAFCISGMKLEDVPPEPANPTPLQAVMYHIVANLKIYKPYLPESLFEEVNEDEEPSSSDDDADGKLKAEGADGRPSADRTISTIVSSAMDVAPRGRSNTMATGITAVTRVVATTARAAGVKSRMQSMATTSSGTASVATSGTINMNIGGNVRHRKMTVMELNIIRFHSLYCSADAGDLIAAFYQRFIALIQSTLKAHGGMMHRFNGDHILASFNSTGKLPNHVIAACKTALSLRASIPAMELEGYHLESIGRPTPVMSLCTGHIWCGNMGSTSLQTFTVISPTVTLLHLLNDLNKTLGSSILVDAYTWQVAKVDYDFRIVDRIRLLAPRPSAEDQVAVASSKPVQTIVFELMQKKQKVTKSENLDWMFALPTSGPEDAFAEGVQHFFAAKFDKAVGCFEAHISRSAKMDAVAQSFLRRSLAKIRQQASSPAPRGTASPRGGGNSYSHQPPQGSLVIRQASSFIQDSLQPIDVDHAATSTGTPSPGATAAGGMLDAVTSIHSGGSASPSASFNMTSTNKPVGAGGGGAGGRPPAYVRTFYGWRNEGEWIVAGGKKTK